MIVLNKRNQLMNQIVARRTEMIEKREENSPKHHDMNYKFAFASNATAGDCG